MTYQTALSKNINYNGNLNPKQVLENTLEDLGLESQDIIHIAATYINNNFIRENKEFKKNTELIDLVKYPAKNFNETEWNDYMIEMKNHGLEKKLEFQTALFAITSEPLLREYFYNKNVGKGKLDLAEKMRDRFNHGELTISFISYLTQGIKTPLTDGFIENIGLGKYLNSLGDLADDSKNSKSIIENILENASIYFSLE